MLKALKPGRVILPCLFLPCVILITACDAGNKTTASFDAEGYQYKGAADPLLSVPSSERAGSLQERFDLIQGRQ